ncbi:MAG TPA: hypothetical protein VE132_16420, partial [Micromonosporaceae bacterium]|nr:hypothetical protein [Micromonosporaceae bacterium]
MPRTIVSSAATVSVTPANRRIEVRRPDQVLASVGASDRRPAGAGETNGYAGAAQTARLSAEPPAPGSTGHPVSADPPIERTAAVPGSGRTVESVEAAGRDTTRSTPPMVGFDAAGADAPPPEE